MIFDPRDPVRQTLFELCRPFGNIRRWAVDWAVQSTNAGVYRCIVTLDEPEQHEAIAKALGGELKGDEVSLEIRVRQ